MKNMLLFLLSMIVAAPAWAGDEPPAATGVVIELKGPAKSVAALVADLEKDKAYQDAACSPGRKSGKAAKIACAQADSALMAFLGKNAPAKVRWSISSTATPATTKSVTPLGCPTGCALMNCPPPGGPYRCCNTKTYAPC